jgi:hypothetical protein
VACRRAGVLLSIVFNASTEEAADELLDGVGPDH